MCPRFSPFPSGIRWLSCKLSPAGGGTLTSCLCCTQCEPCTFIWNAHRVSDYLNSSLSALEDSRRGMLLPNRGSGLWMWSSWLIRLEASHTCWEWGLTWPRALLLRQVYQMVPLKQTLKELQVELHPIHLPDFTICGCNQFHPEFWLLILEFRLLVGCRACTRRFPCLRRFCVYSVQFSSFSWTLDNISIT